MDNIACIVIIIWRVLMMPIAFAYARNMLCGNASSIPTAIKTFITPLPHVTIVFSNLGGGGGGVF